MSEVRPPTSSRLSTTVQDALRLVGDNWRGFLLLACSFALAVMISYQSKIASRPRLALPPAPATTAGLKGFPADVDVVESLLRARKLTPRRHLIGISVSATGGKVDTAQGDVIRYQFRSDAGEGPQPERPFGTLARRPYCGRQTVLINELGIAAEPDEARLACKPLAPALAVPACSFAEVLNKAGAAAGHGRVRAEYFAAAGGPAWRVHLTGAPEAVVVAADCGTLLTGDAARPAGLAE